MEKQQKPTFRQQASPTAPSPTCSTNYATISKIEQNLLLLKSKIGNLLKQQTHTTENIFRVIDSSVSIVRGKLCQSEHFKCGKKRDWVSSTGNWGGNIKKRERKGFRESGKNRSCSSQHNMNKSPSQMIRQASKKNELTRKKQIQQLYSTKKAQKQKIKYSQHKSKDKITQFHLLKKYCIRKQKKVQKQMLQTRLLKLTSQIKKKQAQKQKLDQIVSTNKKVLKNMNNVVSYIGRMDGKEMGAMAEKLGIRGEDIDEGKAREVLAYADELIRGKSRSQSRNRKGKGKENEKFVAK